MKKQKFERHPAGKVPKAACADKRKFIRIGLSSNAVCIFADLDDGLQHFVS